MNLRNFGKTSAQLYPLGFGAMRLPCLDNDTSKINYDKAIEMVRYAIDNGVNYIDTAYNYHGEKSEEFVACALKDGYRDKVYLATKLPVWKAKKYEDFETLFNTQLERLETDHIDMYLTHALDKERWKSIKDLNIFKFLDSLKESGKIRYAGFSFHDDLDTFKEIVDSYSWDFCQIQYNYIDVNYQAGKEGLDYAHSKELGIIVMEPLKGGKLSKTPPLEIKKIWANLADEYTYSELGLRWILDEPKVSILLSGMSNLDQVKENLDSINKFGINNLNLEEKGIYKKVREKFKEYIKVDCTGCGYCMPCPSLVDIPSNFNFYNDAVIFDNKETAKPLYKAWFKDNGAQNCVECGTCITQCPQRIDIIDKLKEVKEYFDN